MWISRKKYNDLLKRIDYQNEVIEKQEEESFKLYLQLVDTEKQIAELKSKKQKTTKTTDKSTKTKNVSRKTTKKKDDKIVVVGTPFFAETETKKTRKPRTKKEEK